MRTVTFAHGQIIAAGGREQGQLLRERGCLVADPLTRPTRTLVLGRTEHDHAAVIGVILDWWNLPGTARHSPSSRSVAPITCALMAAAAPSLSPAAIASKIAVCSGAA